MIEQQEAANEELQAANEEVLSTNEELQSVNEELETSKEEIESTNEEISTVNEELHQRNLELAQTTNDMANLLESVEMPIVLLDRNRRIRRFTPTAATALNLIGTDVGRPLRDFNLPPDMKDVHDMLAAAVERNAPSEREARDHGGRWQLLRVRPYRTDEHRIEGAVLSLVDIDEIKRSAEAVAESEGRFHTLADSAPVLIWVNDLEGARFVNRAFEEFVGIDEAGLRETAWAAFVHSDDREKFLDVYRKAFERRETFHAIARFRRADGVYRWTKSTGVPRFTEGAELIGYIGSTVDINDLKEAEDALRDADRAKNEFLGTLGHELRNPLAAMRNALYSAGAARRPRRRQRPCARRDRPPDGQHGAHRGRPARRLAHHARQGPAAPGAASSWWARCATRSTPPSTNAPATARSWRSPIRTQRCGSMRIRRASTRSSATCSATRPSSRPRREHRRAGRARSPARGRGHGEAIVRFADDGVGIEPEMLPRIFDLFVQGPRTALRMRTGVGIGLTLARQLVELHGGAIEARSEGPGKGSEFIVRLPLCVPPAGASPGGDEPDRRERAMRILVVDDNRDAADGMQVWLRQAGHEVRTAYDGGEALAAVEAFRPEVVLLDIGLPDMSGYEVARRLRSEDAIRDARLVAITGFGRPEDVALSREAGFDEHITKPADPEHVLRLLRRLVSAGQKVES